MITQADIRFAPDGAAMVVLSRTGMDVATETVVSQSGRQIRIGQGAKWFVGIEIPTDEDADAFLAATEIEVVEVDEVGFEFHERVRRA